MKYYAERLNSIVAAVLLLQTLSYKFSAAPESVYIFTELGLEPIGRIAIGIMELLIAILLLFRKTSLIGAILGVGVISGAILSHLFIIGIEVHNDNGLLFGLAVIVLLSCSITIAIQKVKLVLFLKKIINV